MADFSKRTDNVLFAVNHNNHGHGVFIILKGNYGFVDPVIDGVLQMGSTYFSSNEELLSL